MTERGEARELRDLAKQIDRLASMHPAFSMAHGIIANVCEHLHARARVIELEQKLIDGEQIRSDKR